MTRSLLCTCSLLALLASPARAEPLPYATTARAGRPARAVPVRVEQAEGGVRVTAGRSVATLPIAQGASATVEPVPLTGGGAAAIVRVDSGEAHAVALIAGTRPEIVWTGRLDPTGDPGERRRDVIEVADRTGDGQPDVIVGAMSEAVRICGQRETLLAPRAIDPRTMALREVELRKLPEGVDQIALTATATSPGPTGAPLLPALHFQTASSSAGSPDEPGLVPAPVALSDGSASTAWREGRAGAGRWEFATAAFTGGDQRIRALALTMPPAGIGSPPKALYVVTDGGPRLHVTIPEPLAGSAGARAWVALPSPITARCMSIVLDEAWGPGPTALAEIEAYTDLDFGEGLTALVGEVVADSARGPDAARLLATLGEPAVRAVREAWETLTPTGRRRSIRVFAENLSLEAARDALAIAARDEDGDVRADAMRALAEAESPDALASLVHDPRAGDDAAVTLARRHPEAAAPIVLEAIAREGGSERPALRRALRTASGRGGEAARAHIARWVEAEPSMPATAAAALALSVDAEAREVASALLRRGVSGATRFEDRWRLVQAAKKLPSDAAVDRWLTSTATDAEAWMLRAAALEALSARGAPAAREVAREAMDDPYPRVRVAALELLKDDPELVERIAVAARRDGWPMVRASAVAALADDRAALPVLRAAVDDPSKTVRAAAIRALTVARDRASIPLVAARLEDGEELPEVWSAGIAFARALCARELAEPLVAVLRQGMRPNAWATDVDVAAEAIPVLALLGGEAADDALDRASRETAPPAIRAAALQARRSAQNCR